MPATNKLRALVIALAAFLTLGAADAPAPELVQITTPWPMRTLAASADGRFVAAAGGSWRIGAGPNKTDLGVNTDICLYDAHSSVLLRKFTGHELPVLALAISPDGSKLASSSTDNTLRIWDTATGNQLRNYSIPADLHPERFTQLLWAPNGPFANHLIAANEATLAIFDPDSPEPLKIDQRKPSRTTLPNGTIHIALAKPHSSIILTPDGTSLAAMESGKPLCILELGTWKELAEYPDITPTLGAFSPDGKTFICLAQNSTQVWDPSANKKLASWDHPANLKTSAISADGSIIAYADETSARTVGEFYVHVLDAQSGREIAVLPPHMRRISAVLCTADGRRVWSAGDDRKLIGEDIASTDAQERAKHLGEERAIQRGTAAAQRTDAGEILALAGHDGAVESVAISPDAKLLVSGGRDRTIRLWDLATGKELRRIQAVSGSVNTVAISPNSHWIAAVDTALVGAAYNIEGPDFGAAVKPVIFKSSSFLPKKILFSPDSKEIAFGSHLDYLFSLPSGETVSPPATPTSHGDPAFSPDGAQYVAPVARQELALYDSKTRKEIRRFTGHTSSIHCVVFSPDGSQIFSGAQDSTVRIWNTQTGEQQFSLPAMTVAVGIASLPDHRVIAAGYHEIIIWDSATGKELRRINASDDYIYTLSATPDGKRAATSGRDGIVHVWSLEAPAQASPRP